MTKERRILLVDDSESDILLYKRYLTKGFANEKIIFAQSNSGEDALDIFKSFKPDCIILDYYLPDMDGYTLLKKIKASVDKTPCVVMITGAGSEKVAVRVMKEGVYDYISKGDITEDKLCKSLSNALEKHELSVLLEDKTKELSRTNQTLLETVEELNKLKDSLQNKNKNLSRVNTDLDNFIYSASHDLKSPINNLEGLINALIDDIREKNPFTNEIFTLITSSLSRLKATVDNLSQVLTVEQSSNPESVSFEEVFENVKLDLKNQIESSGSIIKVDFSKAPIIQISPKNLRSIIYNIFSNAIKYRDPKKISQIEIHTAQFEKNCILLSIIDNGLGLKESDKVKIFSLFERVHSHIEGTGIGLSLVKKIVDNNGGRIELLSEIGVGSEFRIFLKTAEISLK